MRTTIFLTCVFLCHDATGFTLGGIPKGATVPSYQIKMTPSKIPLQARKEDSNEDQQDNSFKEKQLNTDVPDLVKKSVEFFLLRVLDMTSFAFTFVGVASFCGLLLNFMGYGYHIGQGFTLEIDTLEHMRLQNEFQREIIRSMHDVA